jgi:hypothetical protein
LGVLTQYYVGNYPELAGELADGVPVVARPTRMVVRAFSQFSRVVANICAQGLVLLLFGAATRRSCWSCESEASQSSTISLRFLRASRRFLSICCRLCRMSPFLPVFFPGSMPSSMVSEACYGKACLFKIQSQGDWPGSRYTPFRWFAGQAAKCGQYCKSRRTRLFQRD